MKTKWQEATEWESSWWGDCLNTYSEETKQITYAKKMGLVANMVDGKWPVYDLQGKNIMDIGGGPVSMLLKCVNRGECCYIIDPCEYPTWTEKRYQREDMMFFHMKGEDLDLVPIPHDEVWIYNVLQHTDDPKKIIDNAKKYCKIIRIFEWINIPESDGHIQVLTSENLDKWLGGVGKVEQLNENFCNGTAYYGIFKGHFYEKV